MAPAKKAVNGAATTKAKPAAKPATTKAAPKASAATKKTTTTKTTTTKKTVAPKKAAVPKTEKKTVPKKAEPKPAKNGNGKRPKHDDDEDEDTPMTDVSPEVKEIRPKKKARTAEPKPAAPAGPVGWRKHVVLKRRKAAAVDNPVPSTPLDVFVFGEGTSGELGLGSKKYEGKKPIDVKRPRINHNLGADKVKVVSLACGGMHAIALTQDNKVLTWGVNDDKALGRDTTWDGGLRDVDAEDSDSDDDDDDSGVNPLESTPTQIEAGELLPEDKICKVAATDSASFLLTTDGFVFGWGTFRGADGVIGFTEGTRVQPTPMLIEPLQDITDIACGSNHVVALDVHGKVWTWGSGGQFQLGRKPLTRHSGPTATLKPEPCGMFGKRHFATGIAAGSYHSFYIDNNQRVWSWGLNNFSQTGHFDDTGKDDAMVLQPKLVDTLRDSHVKSISGGEHHSIACTEDGKLLTWGRVDGHQVGQPETLFNEDNAVFEKEKPRILLTPTAVPGIDAKAVAAGVDTSFAIDTSGKAYSWGFSVNYQTGQGTTEDIEVPTLIDNTAVRDKKLVWAGAGGQYAILAAEHGAPAVNGH